MSISKVRLPNNTEEDIKAKYLIQSTSADAVSAEFSARAVTEDAIANVQKIYGNTVVVSDNLVSNSATAILSRGTNQWDEQWRNGYYGETTGVYADAAYVCTKNPIHITGREQYYLRMGESARIYISYYNSQGSLINTTTWKVVYSGNTFTPPPDATSMNFWVVGTYGGSYKNDICINISDTSKNGTYEPYNGHQIDLNIPTLTGKLNGAGSSVVIFPDGMKKAGTVYDELVGNKAIKRVGSVDMGTLTWTYSSTYGVFFNPTWGTVPAGFDTSGTGASAVYNIIANSSSEPSGWANMSLMFRSGYIGQNLCIKNTSYTDSATFKTAMSGVMLYYTLSSPQEYILDNALQLQYPVVAGGTEMVLPTTGTAPMKMDVIYGNAADATSNLSSNFISVDSMKAFLNNLGTQMGGTWNMQYNNGKFEFTFSSS